MASSEMFKRPRVHTHGGPESIVVESAPLSELTPGAGQVLVRIEAAGVNPVETYIRSGNYARKPALPFTLGADGAGSVAAVGDDVGRWAVGDRVFLSGSLSGTYAQYALCLEAHLHVLPAAFEFAQGAAIGIAYRTAHRALFQRAKARPGEWLLVHGGSGGVGVATIELARAAGLRIVATAGTQQGLDLITSKGATALSHREEGYMLKAAELTGGHGFDVIVEMLSNVNLGADLEIVAMYGRVAVVGCRGSAEINPRLLMQKSSSIVGVLGATPEEERETWAAIEAAALTTAIAPVAGQRFALDKAAQAHVEVIEHTRGSQGKIILEPWQ